MLLHALLYLGVSLPDVSFTTYHHEGLARVSSSKLLIFLEIKTMIMGFPSAIKLRVGNSIWFKLIVFSSQNH